MQRVRLLLLLVAMVFLAGCAEYVVIVGENGEDAYASLSLNFNQDLMSKSNLDGYLSMARALWPIDDQRLTIVNHAKGDDFDAYVEATTQRISINEVRYLSVAKQSDGTVKYTLDIPVMVAEKWVADNPDAWFTVKLYLPGQFVEANSFEVYEGYVMKRYYQGQSKTCIRWVVTGDRLLKPLHLWATVKPEPIQPPSSHSAILTSEP